MDETYNAHSKNPFVIMSPGQLAVCLFISILLATCAYRYFRRWDKVGDAPWMKETIPYVTNAWQYLTDMQGFLDRAK